MGVHIPQLPAVIGGIRDLSGIGVRIARIVSFKIGLAERHAHEPDIISRAGRFRRVQCLFIKTVHKRQIHVFHDIICGIPYRDLTVKDRLAVPDHVSHIGRAFAEEPAKCRKSLLKGK